MSVRFIAVSFFFLLAKSYAMHIGAGVLKLSVREWQSRSFWGAVSIANCHIYRIHFWRYDCHWRVSEMV